MKPQKADNELIEAYWEAYKDSESVYSMLPRACGLSDAEYWSLVMIQEGIDTQSDICSQLCISKQTVNSAFRQLVKKELVRLEVMEENMRTKKIFITEKGRLFVKKYIVPLLELEEAAWRRMDKEERSELIRITKKYNCLLRESLNNYQQPE